MRISYFIVTFFYEFDLFIYLLQKHHKKAKKCPVLILILIHFNVLFYYFSIDIRSSMSVATTDGSAKVEISPRSSTCMAAIFLNILRMIFPDRVLGNPGAIMIISGVAKAPI